MVQSFPESSRGIHSSREGAGVPQREDEPAPETPDFLPQCRSGGKQEGDCQLSRQQSAAARAVGDKEESQLQTVGLEPLRVGRGRARLQDDNSLLPAPVPGAGPAPSSPDPVGNLWVHRYTRWAPLQFRLHPG